MNFLIAGPPGSGKSTQANLLAKKLNLPHLSTGDLCRDLSKENTPRGRKIRKIIESGGLLDDRFILKIVENQLREDQYQNGFVLDGTPRSLWQARNFKIKFDKVIYLVVSDKESLARLIKRGRKDTDSPAIIKKRLAVYHQKTELMLAYYRKLGILEEVDGERPVEVIFQDILSRLKLKQ